MRPVTTSNFSRSGAASVRSGFVSIRTGTRTAASSIRPLTTSRSSQPSTGKHAANLPSQEVRISERPVTAAGGLGGIQPKNNPNGYHLTRQRIQDGPYYLNLLKVKEREITNEITKLNNDIQNYSSSSINSSSSITMTTSSTHHDYDHDHVHTYDSSYKSGTRTTNGNIEVFYQELVKEVRDLEGTLADYNVANDKLRQGFDPEEMEYRSMELKMKNEKVANELDVIFVSKQTCETNIQDIEHDIQKMHESIKSRLQGADSTILNDYQKKTMRIQDLQSEEKTIEVQLEKMKAQLYQLQMVASNSNDYELRKLYKMEEKKVDKLKRDTLQIDEELHIAQMNPDEAHTYLLDEVKSTQAQVKELSMEEIKMTQEINDLKAMDENFQNRIQEREIALQVHQSNGKMNIALDESNEAELDKYIQNAKETMENILNDQKTTQAEIVSLLEDLSKHIHTCNASKPTEKGLQELNEDVDFRTKHLANSQQTMTRLVEQKDKRLQELQMVENLEGKILSEEKELDAAMKRMLSESDHYSDLNRLQELAEITKAYLIQMKERYISRRDFMNSKVREVSENNEEKKNALENSDTWKSLLELEEKLRRQGQVVFTLQKFVQAKEQQTNYETMKSACLKTMNELLIESLNHQNRRF